MKSSSLIAPALFVVMANVRAAPALEGVVEPLDSAVSIVALERRGVVWQREVQTDSESSYFRLHFSDISASEGLDFTLRIRNRANQVVLTTPGPALAKAGDYWTTYLSGTYALVEIENRGTASGTLSLKIAEVATERRGARVLNIQDPLDPKDRPVWAYEGNEGLTKASRGVAKLRYVKERSMLTCTGFMVSDSLMLTNQHCFDTAAVCATAIAQFGYQEDHNRDLSDGEEFPCEEVKDSDPGLDFTLIKLARSPGTRWGVLRWQLQSPASGTPIYIVQHPGGAPKRVALDGCAVKTADAVAGVPGEATDFGHTCDTENGSSGSPVLDMSNRVVALHHLGFTTGDPVWSRENRAVKAAALQRRITRYLQ